VASEIKYSTEKTGGEIAIILSKFKNAYGSS
jgi:hypothetical protein